MTNKELIIRLVQQDLKHHQLTLGLEKLGLSTLENHQLEIHSIIAELLELPEAVKLTWGDQYIDQMQAALSISSNDDEQSLQRLSENIYRELAFETSFITHKELM